MRARCCCNILCQRRCFLLYLQLIFVVVTQVILFYFTYTILLLLFSLLLRFHWLFSGNFSFGYPQNHELNRARLFCVSARSYTADYPSTAPMSIAVPPNRSTTSCGLRWVRAPAVSKAHTTQTQHPPEQQILATTSIEIATVRR